LQVQVRKPPPKLGVLGFQFVTVKRRLGAHYHRCVQHAGIVG
jgi:hypothetical protein